MASSQPSKRPSKVTVAGAGGGSTGQPVKFARRTSSGQTGLCPGCKEPYKPNDGEDDGPTGSLSVSGPDGKRAMSLVRQNQKGEFDNKGLFNETSGSYGIGSAYWPPDDGGGGGGKGSGGGFGDPADKPWRPLTRRLPMPKSIISPYRLLIVVRFIVLCFYLTWRISHPNDEAMWLWFMSIVCEMWFAFSWILDQIQSFVRKEPPLVTANTILSILAVEYPVEKLACYISDDGGALLTFEAMAEACSFADLWVPFCRKHDIEPRNPDTYFSLKGDPTKNKTRMDFVKDRRRVKREYDEFKVRINNLPDSIRRRSDAFNAREEMKIFKSIRERGVDPTEPIKVKRATWMADGTHWPGTWTNPSRDHAKGDHAGILQIMLKPPSPDPLHGSGEEGLIDYSDVDIRLPMFVYMSREKRSGYDHNKKAGAMNALVRSSAVLSNGPFILNLDCDHYIYNCMAVREGICFMMDRGGEDICYIQFPQRFEGIDPSDRYANHNTVFFDGNMRALDGVQGPFYVGTGCMFRRFALYEDKTEWGDRVGWIYGSVTEDVVTGYRMHNRGWRSIYCLTKRDAFRGSAPINLTDRLHQVLRWATGSVEIFFSRNNAFLASKRLKWLQRLAYINVGVYPFTSLFLIVYCFLPALSLLSGHFIVKNLNATFLMYLLLMTLCLIGLAVLEVRWSEVSLEDWWRNEQFWLISGTSAHLAAVIQGLLKVMAGIEISFTLTSKAVEDSDDAYAELYLVKWTSLMIPPIVIAMINVLAMVVAFSRTIYSISPQWGKFVGGAFFSFWVLAHFLTVRNTSDNSEQ
ncbi:hypothetical protein E3N88_45891 [Mikania micrantha]|uniref:Uncharacterized protein n=1 Tax=Mikania micrantha TaxID=192012 RepID=A0A5N6L7S4_9ASTR|nr:hypothetical protein E3N88_45891 [Mikania micrantha]